MFNFSLTIDPVTVLEHMRQNGVYDENTSRKYILQLMEVTPPRPTWGVRGHRQGQGPAAAHRRDGGRPDRHGPGGHRHRPGGAGGRGAAHLRHPAGAGRPGADTHLPASSSDVYERLNELAASDSAVPGLSTGLPDVDAAISGLNKSDLILLAARPGMGKTSMALNILLHAGKFSGKTVVFFSLEMSREQLAMRLISGEAFVDNKKLVTGKLRGGLGKRSPPPPPPEPDQHSHRRQPPSRWPT